MRRKERQGRPEKRPGKRVGQLTAQNAARESRIHGLGSQIEELRGPKNRKQVVVDSDRFANMDAIKKAMDEAAEQEARVKPDSHERKLKKKKRRQVN
jgi:hypothetical protein